MLTIKQWEHCLEEMDNMFPDAHCELVYSNPFELLIATLLSAQCTDQLVNKVTKDLFQKYKTPEDYLSVPLEELQQGQYQLPWFGNILQVRTENVDNRIHVLADCQRCRHLQLKRRRGKRR